jgi:hypothetical protein
MRIKAIQFPQGNRARAIYVPQDAAGQQIFDALDLPQPRALVVLNGGTAGIEAGLQARLGRLLQDGLARVAAEEQITMITGGTDAGIFGLLGAGLAKWGRTAPCIGVTVSGWVTWPGRIPRWLPRRWFDRGRIPLEPHHSHFVLVEAHDWGDETATMYELVVALSQNGPSLVIFAGGGGITMREMEANARLGQRMILLAGSGRTTDAVLAARAGARASDTRFADIVRQGKIIPFAVDQEPLTLIDLVRRTLFKETGGR